MVLLHRCLGGLKTCAYSDQPFGLAWGTFLVLMWCGMIIQHFIEGGWRIKSHFARRCYEYLGEQVGDSSTSPHPIKTPNISSIYPKLSYLLAWMFQLWLVLAYFFVLVFTWFVLKLGGMKDWHYVAHAWRAMPQVIQEVWYNVTMDRASIVYKKVLTVGELQRYLES